MHDQQVIKDFDQNLFIRHTVIFDIKCWSHLMSLVTGSTVVNTG